MLLLECLRKQCSHPAKGLTLDPLEHRDHLPPGKTKKQITGKESDQDEEEDDDAVEAEAEAAATRGGEALFGHLQVPSHPDDGRQPEGRTARGGYGHLVPGSAFYQNPR